MDDKYLKNYLNEHFCYETKMLHFSLNSHKKYIQKSNQYGIFMAIECFIFHGRNLLEFFYYKPTKNYTRATHFIDENVWKQKRPQKTKNITELERRSSPEVLHLTFDRISGAPPEKQWDISGCFYDLLDIINNFLNILPNKFHGSDIKSLKDYLDKIKN